MRMTTNADCMASSAPNPYGQAPAQGVHMHYAGDYGGQTQPGRQQQQPQQLHHQQQQLQANEPGIVAYGDSTQALQGRANLVGGEKPLVHLSNTSLANYDSYISGMSSDSELTTSSTAARHHHHHHRPYSSQSRVYHAHPVPRNTPAASRLSHYSSNSAVNVHSAAGPHSSPYSPSQQQQQLQFQHQLPSHNQALSTTPPSKQISSISHQSSVASSCGGGGSSLSSGSYLPATMSQDSPVSPVIMRQQQQQQPMRRPASGRQLPQRPFAQSMSIDQHSPRAANHYHQQATTGVSVHSPAHEPPSLHRNLTGDQIGGVGGGGGAAGYQQKSYPGVSARFEPTASHSYSETMSHRNVRLEMERVEMQAAALSLYEPSEAAGSLVDLPPAGPTRSVSSSSGRHLPNTTGLQQHQTLDLYNQGSQDPYSSQAQTHRKVPEWLPAGSGQSPGRPASQFRQTMSIDHYPANSRQQQKQQQQRHFPGAKQAQFASTDQYHSLGHAEYATGGGLASAPGAAAATNQLALIGANYEPELMAGQSQSAGPLQDQNLKYHHYPSASASAATTTTTTATTAPATTEQQSNYPGPEARGSQVGGANSDQHQAYHERPHHHLSGRPKLQHQPSSSSSNSNLSGSLKSSNLETAGGANLEKRDANTGAEPQGQKSFSSGLTSSQQALHHYLQQSPQHKQLPPASGGHHGGRQDLLRRGHTSVTVSSGGSGDRGGHGYDFGGSQSALSESGDLSMMQTSHSSHTGRRLRAASPSAALEASSSSGPHPGGSYYAAGATSHPHHHQHHHHHHSTSSGHGLREGAGMRSESTTGLPNGSGGSSTLTKKSNSASQLSMTGTKKRLGFRKKQVTSFSVHRSEEVAPLEARHLVKQGSSVSEGDSSMSGDSSSRSWSTSKQTPEELASMSFIDGLGKGQMISRQGLASPYLGDIQLSLCDRRGNLEIEVIRARSLQAKTNKILPLTYVKLYLVKNRKCLAKAKTTLSNKRTLNPLFQQQLTFHEDYRGCILQSIVWGNFGKMDKKNFMGIAQISIDDLELSDTVISWYKLFLPSSLQTLPSKSLRHTLLSNSTESFTTTTNNS